jgi:hypothetical protein
MILQPQSSTNVIVKRYYDAIVTYIEKKAGEAGVLTGMTSRLSAK